MSKQKIHTYKYIYISFIQTQVMTVEYGQRSIPATIPQFRSRHSKFWHPLWHYVAIKTAGAPRKDSSLQIDQSLPPLGSNIPFPKMRLHQLFLGWHPKGLEQRLLRRNGKTKLASSSTPLDFEVFPKYIIINSLVIYPYSHPMKLP